MFFSRSIFFGISGLNDSNDAVLISDSPTSFEARMTLSNVVVYLYGNDICNVLHSVYKHGSKGIVYISYFNIHHIIIKLNHPISKD